MNKKDLIKSTFRRLIEVNSLNEITVNRLCKESGVTRQTFYYHYKDISDVLTDFFLNEKIANLDEANSWPNLVHTILVYANLHRQLILKTLKSKVSNVVTDFFFNNLYKRGRSLIEMQYDKILSDSDISEVAKLTSDAMSREMARLLSSPNELSISSIEEEISKTFDGVLDLICMNRVHRGKKK